MLFFVLFFFGVFFFVFFPESPFFYLLSRCVDRNPIPSLFDVIVENGPGILKRLSIAAFSSLEAPPFKI